MQTTSSNRLSAPPPPRNPRPNANATQEVQAADVLEVIEKAGLAARPAPLPRFEDAIDEVSVEIVPDESPRFRTSSASSIAPVDLNLAPPLDDEMTGSIDVVAVARRKRFSLIVGAAVGSAAVLLVIGIGCKLAGGSNDSESSTASGVAATQAPTAATQKPATATAFTVALPAVTAPKTTTASTPAPATASTIGTLIVDGKPKKVWLDGKRLSGSSAMIQCGSHKVKIGKTSVQMVDVPCGGETHVTKS
jgi:hypothetical protein